MIHTQYFSSPLGVLLIQSTDEAIVAVSFTGEAMPKQPPALHVNESPPIVPEPLSRCIEQLDEYFRGTRTQFSVPLALTGSAFEKLVWNELMKLSFGQTATYAEVALRLGNRRAVRAVGSAAGKNKILILIPCHRMVGTRNSLSGYAAGSWRKEWLLQHEAGIPAQPSLF